MTGFEILGVISFILWPVSIFSYIIYNLLQKNKKLEDMVLQDRMLMSNLSSLIQESHQIIEEAEVSGAFKSDDQVGGFFTILKNIQKALDSYNVNRTVSDGQ